jgi:hypothetical protein
MPRQSRKPQHSAPQGVGTLWTLRREEYTASCSLLSWSPGWELRVLMQNDVLLSQRCSTTADAFELAEHWRRGLLEHGWQQIIPMPGIGAAFRDGRRDDGTAVAL